MTTSDDREFRKRMERFETLLKEIEQFDDARARDHTRALVQALMDLHGTALERMLDQIAATGLPGLATIDTLAKDDLIGNVLLLYGLHPLDLETRVRQALDRVRSHLHSHGATIEMVGIVSGVVRLRLLASGDEISSSASTLRQSIESAIYDKASDVAGIEVEEVVSSEAVVGNGIARMALPVLSR